MSGPDIFLSYNREDSERAKQFAEGFAAQGLDVWWDVALRSGEAYDEVTETALRNAKAVVVLWSKKSVVSRWVRAEATLAERKKTLMPAMIEPCERPIMFELVQTADLSAWHGSTSDRAWQAFASHVREFVGKAAPAKLSTDGRELPLPALDQVTLVVLPFANMSRDEEQEYFADGITEDVITDLSKVSALGVVARNTAFTFKGKHVDIGDVARQLNVTHVLEGSVRKAGNRVRVTAQLIDGSTGNHVWAERYDRDLNDIFALQDELSQAIVKALKVKLLPAEKQAISDRGTDNLEAYDKFLRARALANQLGAESLSRAASLLREAITLDRKFLPAYSVLADTLHLSTTIVPEGAEAAWTEIGEIEEEVAAFAPGDPNALIIRAMLLGHQYRFEEAERFLDQLRDARMGGPFWTKGVYHAYVCRFDQALESARELVRLDPLSFLYSLTLSDFLETTGRRDEAQTEDNRSTDFAGNRGYIEYRVFMRMKGRATPGQLDEQYQRFLAARGTEMRIPLFEKLASVLHDHQAALALVREAIHSSEWRDPTRQIWFAFMAGYYDAPDDALAALRHAYVDRHPALGILQYMWCPVLRPAHLDPRFKDILRDMGLVDYWRKTGRWGDFVRPRGKEDFEVVFP